MYTTIFLGLLKIGILKNNKGSMKTILMCIILQVIY